MIKIDSKEKNKRNKDGLFLLSEEKHRPHRMEPQASGDEGETDQLKESVKKATLFERSEFGAFSERKPGCSEADVALELCINPSRSALSKRAWLLPLLIGIFFASFLWFKPKK